MACFPQLTPIKNGAGGRYRNAGNAIKPYQEARFRTLLLEFEPRPAKWFDDHPQDACAGDDSDLTSIALSIDHIPASRLGIAELVVIAFSLPLLCFGFLSSAAEK